MSMYAALNFRNPTIIKKAGMVALKKELGTVGTAYFMRQFDVGYGDYTAERDKLHEGITLEDIIKNVRRIDAEKI